MSDQDEDLLFSHDEDQPTSAHLASSPLTPEASSKIASEMHRWGRMTGVFSIIVLVIWLVLGAVSSAGTGVPVSSAAPGAPSEGVTVLSADPGMAAVRSSLLWPGVALAILAAIGLLGGFRFDYLAGRKGRSAER
jgi:hypothetical protein